MKESSQLSKEMALLAQITKGLLTHGLQETASQLGDRSEYIGMSDIGKGAECMRAAVANKLYGIGNPQPDEITFWYQQQQFENVHKALSKQLTLQRGHWLEGGIMNAFNANGSKVLPQLEIEVTLDDGTPIKAHLDFVLIRGGEQPAVRIVEIKSTENLPKTLYTSYEQQLYGQLGFLYRYWHEPCFNLKDETGKQKYSKLTFPELVKQEFGIELPAMSRHVDIEGWVLALAMSDAKAFGPYIPDPSIFKLCCKTAAAIWTGAHEVKSCAKDLNCLDYCKYFQPLCNYCSHNTDCPKFKSHQIIDPGCNDMLIQLDKLKLQKKSVEKEIAEVENRLKSFYRQFNTEDWLSTTDYRFRCSEINGRKQINKHTLMAELATLISPEQVDRMINRHTTQGAPYERLYTSKI